jgi:thiosulfate reductase cytochrome b subunit
MFGDWQALRIVHLASVPLVTIFVIIHWTLGKKSGGEKLIESMFW